MKQYIDKSAVVAEIEGLKRNTFTNFDEGVNAAAQILLEFLDTLEVKESLTWEEIRELYIIFAEVDAEIELCKVDIKSETIGYYQEVLKRFKTQKGEKVMKENELMIGDWVVGCSGEPFKIGIVDPDFLHWNEIQPIPLTPEILEKNEFFKSYDDDGIHYKYTLISDGIGFSLKYVRSVFQWLGPLDFKYVHELQHVLKLCGIKKEIEL